MSATLSSSVASALLARPRMIQLRHRRQLMWSQGVNVKCQRRSPLPHATSKSSEGNYIAIPESKEAAISEATAAILCQVKDLIPKARSSRGFSRKNAGNPCLCVDIPSASEDPRDAAEMAIDIASRISLESAAQCVVAIADEGIAKSMATAARQKPGRVEVLNLREACRRSQLTSSILIVAGPRIPEVALCDQLVREVWSGAAAVLVNAEFMSMSPSALSEDLRPFLESLAVLYAFQPVAVKGLLGNKEGAVLKRVRAGAPEKTPWQVLQQAGGDRFVQIGQTKTQPSSDDLQVIFINASAAKSPLSKVAKGFRSIFSKQ